MDAAGAISGDVVLLVAYPAESQGSPGPHQTGLCQFGGVVCQGGLPQVSQFGADLAICDTFHKSLISQQVLDPVSSLSVSLQGMAKFCERLIFWVLVDSWAVKLSMCWGPKWDDRASTILS